jgi:hypothetical protein
MSGTNGSRTLLQCIGIIESHGRYHATRFESHLHTSPPVWLMRGFDNLVKFNPDLVHGAHRIALATSYGKYQILGGNIYMSKQWNGIQYEKPLDTWINSEADQEEFGALQIRLMTRFSDQMLLRDMSNDDVALVARRYNGPGAIAAYSAKLRRADREGV